MLCAGLVQGLRAKIIRYEIDKGSLRRPDLVAKMVDYVDRNRFRSMPWQNVHKFIGRQFLGNIVLAPSS